LTFTGSGSYNNSSAEFQVCVEDNGQPGKESDQFYLTCTTGCTYDTAASNVIGGGNIQVQQGSAASSGGGSTQTGPSTLILDPLLIDEGIAGQLQTFTIRAFDQNQNRLANSTITLVRTAEDGSVNSFTAMTNSAGLASISLVNLGSSSEYRTISNGVESNNMTIAPVLTFP
jgi:hypothetical protein